MADSKYTGGQIDAAVRAMSLMPGLFLAVNQYDSDMASIQSWLTSFQGLQNDYSSTFQTWTDRLSALWSDWDFDSNGDIKTFINSNWKKIGINPDSKTFVSGSLDTGVAKAYGDYSYDMSDIVTNWWLVEGQDKLQPFLNTIQPSDTSKNWGIAGYQQI